jgi:hypothetical protein
MQAMNSQWEDDKIKILKSFSHFKEKLFYLCIEKVVPLCYLANVIFDSLSGDGSDRLNQKREG